MEEAALDAGSRKRGAGAQKGRAGKRKKVSAADEKPPTQVGMPTSRVSTTVFTCDTVLQLLVCGGYVLMYDVKCRAGPLGFLLEHR